MPNGAPDLALVRRVRAGLELPRQSPLDYWRFAVPRLRELFSMFTGPEPIHEGHIRGPNKGTKSQSTAAYVVACLQKRTHLDGIPLPEWQGRVTAAQLVLDFQQQILSVQEAYTKVLGHWPHHERKAGQYLSSLSVMPVGGNPDDETDWSLVHFLSQKNPDSGVGARADIVAFDEPPKMPVLRELRKAAHAGRRGIRIIAETPTKRSQWAELKEDYGDSPRATIRRVDRLRAECRWSLDEVADWCLSPQEKLDLWDSYRGDPLFGEDGGARWHGDYMATEGACPFDVATIVKMMAEWCTDPDPVSWRVPVETVGGKPALVAKVDLHVWDKPKPGRTYYIPIDPSSGVDDKRHDPAALHVVETISGDIVATHESRIAPYALGVLAAGVARQYNAAVIDPEVNDGWGLTVLNGIRDSGYGNIGHEMRELSPGSWSKEVGFRTTKDSRGHMIGAVQAWIEAFRAGAPYGKCQSRRVFEELLDCELDENNKIVAASGSHDEHLILRGQGLRKCVNRSGRAIPEIQLPPTTKDQRIIARMLESDVVDEDGERPELLVPRSRPRV